MDEGFANRRQFVRHPIQVPLTVRPKDGAEFLTRVGDISEGGVSFSSPQPLAVGHAVEVVIPVHDSRFTLTGTVASVVELGGGALRIGLKFVDTDARFKMKLAEQVLRIEDLRETLSRERGTPVTNREAAEIWVDRYAKNFAELLQQR
jgi:hypothetical protein